MVKENMDITIKRWIICLAVLFPVWFVVLLLIISESVSFTVAGFGVDSEGRLYIGKPHNIEVYEHGKLNKIPLPPNRTYVFVLEGENLLLSDSSKQYVLALDGTILDSRADTGLFNDIERFYRRNKWEVPGEDGHLYRREILLGRYRFVRDDAETVYKMPLLDYCVKILLIVMICLFSVGIKQILAYSFHHFSSWGDYT